MSRGEMKGCKLIFSALVNPALEEVHFALPDLLIKVKLVLPRILEENLEAVALVSVGSICENGKLALILHAHKVKWSSLEAKVLHQTLIVLV